MHSTRWRTVFALSWVVACSGAERSAAVAPAPSEPALPAPAPAVPLAPPTRPELRADLASPPLEDQPALSVAEWHQRHAELSSAPKRGVSQLIVFGDSIGQGWAESRAFQKQWRQRQPLNLSLGGDQTQQLLWRIEHGALDGLSPRLVIVCSGTENLLHGFAPSETVRGVRAVLSQVRERLPKSKVLVLGLLPAGQSASDPRRAQIQVINAELSALAEPERVAVTDVGGVFLDADGSISPNVMADFVHPTALGYEALTLSVSLVAASLLD